VLEVLEDGDGLAIAMSLAPGGSLDALLSQRTRLAPGEVVAVARPIADALASAHRRNIVHGDVKPANILFTSDGEPLLSDFGVARTLGKLTNEHVTGTATYLAPELLDGAQPDVRCDIYSLAVVCYEALAGEPPYTGDVPLAVARAADRGDHRSLVTMPGVPRPLAEVVERAMARDPERRFSSAEAFSNALRDAIPPGATHLPGIARPSSTDDAIPPDATHLPGIARPSSTDDAIPPDATHLPGIARPSSTDDAIPPDATHLPGIGGSSLTDGDSAGATRTFGPRPPRPPVPPPARRRRVSRPAAVAAGAAAVVGVGLGLLLQERLTSAGPEDAGGPDSSAVDGSATAERLPTDDTSGCPELEAPSTGPDVGVVRGDPEGDGCDTLGTYQLRGLRSGRETMILTIDVDGEESFIGLGEPGDQLLLGDWDCDGADTPGLYKPGRGEVQYFNVWPETPDQRYLPDTTDSAPAGGNATVVEPGGECERLGVIAPA
jgi:hypothetical protein